MPNDPLNFPVFYACAIKGRTGRKQMDVVQALLTGKYAQECLEGEKIQESMISSYISGRRRISVQAIYAVSACSHEELVRRFQMVDLYNSDDSARNVRRFLEELCPVGETETRRLLAYGESCETPLDFLAEVFLAALRCPPGEVGVLTEDTQRRLHDGVFSEASGEASAPDVRTQRKEALPVDEIENNAIFDYELRQLKLRTPEQREQIRRYMDALIQNGIAGAGGRAPIIREGEEGLEPFWTMLATGTNGVFYEIQGTNAQLRETLRNLSTLNQCRGAVLFMDSNPEIGMPDFYAIRDDVARRCLPEAGVSAFLRISDRMDGKNTLYVVLIANPAGANRRQRPSSTVRAPARKKRFY